MKVAQDLMIEVPVEIPTLHINDYITKARQILRDYVVRELFVREDNGSLAGYIDITDVLRVTDTKSNVTIAGFIKEAPSVSFSDSIETVAGVIRKAGTGSIAVIDENGALKGVILLSELFPILITRHELWGHVGDFMTQDVVTCAPGDSLSKLYTKIVESSYDAFPVVMDNKVIGMISRSDLLRRGKIRQSVGNAANTPVESVMTTPAITVAPDEDISTAAERLIYHDISRLPVIEHNKIVGILDRHDVLKGLKI